MKLAEGIHSIADTRGGRVHAFLVEHGRDLILIDTLYAFDGHLVLDEIRRLGRSVSDLKKIVITHAHRSHLGGLAKLKQLSGAKVLAHEWEADIVAGNRKAQPVSILPRRPLRAYFPFQFFLALGKGSHPACPVDDTLEDEQDVGGTVVLHTPGHTPGHLALYSEEKRVLISGDAIATWPRFEAGWPGFTLDREKHRTSVRRMAALEPRAVGVGHGEPITDGAAERVYSLVER